MPSALDVVGQLMVEMGGDGSIRIECRGETIVVELPSLRSGLGLLKRWPGSRGQRQMAIKRVHEGLNDAGLTLVAQVGSAVIGRLGRGAKAGLASRLLGLAPMEISPSGLLALRRQRPGHPPK